MVDQSQQYELKQFIPGDGGEFDRDTYWQTETQEVINDLLRALRRKKGFALFFVQCNPAQAKQTVGAIKAKLPKKRLAEFELNCESETLYGDLLEQYQTEPFDIACITGIEQALYTYEDTKRLAGWTSEEIYTYSWKGLPPILGHLNRQREAFENNLPVSILFLVPSFVIDYFVQRAPDFFDWRSGFFRFPTDLNDLQKLSDELTQKENKYSELTEEEHLQKIFEIKNLLTTENLDQDIHVSLLREQAHLFESIDNFKQALDCYNRALILEPKHVETLCEKGYALRYIGRDEEALQSYDVALEVAPKDGEIWNYRGVTLANLQRYEESIRSFDIALECNPEVDYVWGNKGVVLSEMGREKDAIAVFDLALQSIEDSSYIWHHRARVLGEYGSPIEVLYSYSKALEIEPENPVIWNNRGSFKYSLSEYEASISDYERSLKIEPDYYPALIGITKSCLRLRDYKNALSRIERALEMQSSSSYAWLLKAATLEGLKLHDEADSIYKRNENIKSSQNFWDWYHQAYGLYYLKEYGKASKSFKTAIELANSRQGGDHIWYANFIGVRIKRRSNPSYLFWYGYSISQFRLKRYQESISSLTNFFSSPYPYKDLFYLMGVFFLSIMTGKVKYKEFKNTFDLWTRQIGLRR